MACYVLRCEKSGTQVTTLDDLGISDTGIRYDVLLCDEHHYRLTDGERCSWIAEDRALVVGEDLDSGGHLVPAGEWSIQAALGRTEVTLEVETPSGKPAEPVKFLVPQASLPKWLDFLRSLNAETPDEVEPS
jgi:hypothetical protein